VIVHVLYMNIIIKITIVEMK